MDVLQETSPSPESMLETQRKNAELSPAQIEAKGLETKLGIETAENRLIEASLFIDQNLLT